MASFVKLDDKNVVIDVISVSNDVVNNLPFPESEPLGVLFLSQVYDGYANWKQASYNSNFRKNFAGIDYTYDATLDAFIAPKPYPSWLLNTDTCQWKAPVPYPNDGNNYYWNEEAQQWVEITGA